MYTLLLYEVVYRSQLRYIQLTDGIVEFTDVLTDFLPAGACPFLRKDVEVSNYDSEFTYFSSHTLTLYC